MEPVPGAGEHPSREELAAFGLGRLDGNRSEIVAEHLAGCLACQQVIGATPADGLVQLLREARSEEHGIQATGPDAGGTPASRTAARKTQEEEPADAPEVLRRHPRYRPVRLLGKG